MESGTDALWQREVGHASSADLPSGAEAAVHSSSISRPSPKVLQVRRFICPLASLLNRDSELLGSIARKSAVALPIEY
jgi:hypothetical protein